MQKIISLFQRNYDGDRQVRDEVTPGAEWVVAGEGIATRKWDGTCCKVEAGILYKRYDARNGKTPPEGFIPAQDPDVKTGHWPGWLACRTDEPSDKWFVEGFTSLCGIHMGNPPEGTYELIGPRINGNPEKMRHHTMERHGDDPLLEVPRTFNELKQWLGARAIEGIVWHHPDGRMVKIKAKDFGIKRTS
jgi:hypothetical protein